MILGNNGTFIRNLEFSLLGWCQKKQRNTSCIPSHVPIGLDFFFVFLVLVFPFGLRIFVFFWVCLLLLFCHFWFGLWNRETVTL